MVRPPITCVLQWPLLSPIIVFAQLHFIFVVPPSIETLCFHAISIMLPSEFVGTLGSADEEAPPTGKMINEDMIKSKGKKNAVDRKKWTRALKRGAEMSRIYKGRGAEYVRRGDLLIGEIPKLRSNWTAIGRV